MRLQEIAQGACSSHKFRDVRKRLCPDKSSKKIVIPSVARNLLLTREWRFYVYILASKSRRLYTGMTNSIFNRVMQHKSGELGGFTKRYKINRLVYYEEFKYVKNCIARETEIKKWSCAKKVALIEENNPTWEDLAEHWGEKLEPQSPLVLGKPKSRFLTAEAVRNDNFSSAASCWTAFVGLLLIESFLLRAITKRHHNLRYGYEQIDIAFK